MIKTESELFSEARTLVCQAISDLAACGPVDGDMLADYALDTLYGEIELEVTFEMKKKLGKSLEYYC
jgi:hypothetical protein